MANTIGLIICFLSLLGIFVFRFLFSFSPAVVDPPSFPLIRALSFLTFFFTDQGSNVQRLRFFLSFLLSSFFFFFFKLREPRINVRNACKKIKRRVATQRGGFLRLASREAYRRHEGAASTPAPFTLTPDFSNRVDRVPSRVLFSTTRNRKSNVFVVAPTPYYLSRNVSFFLFFFLPRI